MIIVSGSLQSGGIMKIDQGAISFSGHHWKHGPWPPSAYVSLTSARDIITRRPDINPDTVCSDKKVETRGGHFSQEAIRQTQTLFSMTLCSFSGCVYEDMKNS